MVLLAWSAGAQTRKTSAEVAPCPKPASCYEARQVLEVVEAVAPDYPAVALNARVLGEVQLAATLSADGTVEKVEVCRGAFPPFVDASRQAIQRWRFAQDPRPEQRRVAMVTFDFRIEQDYGRTVFTLPDRMQVVARDRPIK